MENKTTEDQYYDPGTETIYFFDEETKLFKSKDSDKPKKGFLNDDNFSDWLHKYVIKMMLKEGLIESFVPAEGGSSIYHTPNAFKNPKNLLVLIQGTGRVRVGVWSVGLIAYGGLLGGYVLSGII